MRISVCISTYNRLTRLRLVLDDLAAQSRPPFEVIVVDNDPAGSARSVVVAVNSASPPFTVRYDIQPEKNIALTRNRTVTLAQGEWLAFIDDDERAPVTWLEGLATAAERFGADVVLAPVVPLLPATAAPWLQRSGLYEWPRLPTGTVVPIRLMRFGNLLLRADILQSQSVIFDPAYGLTGGEDGDFLARLAQAGARVIWCDEAIVTEPVEPARQSLRWLLLRALRGGQDYARHVLAGRHGKPTAARRIRLLIRAFAQLLTAGLLALLCLPFGRHWAARWLSKASANLGKVSTFAGLHYQEYA